MRFSQRFIFDTEENTDEDIEEKTEGSKGQISKVKKWCDE